MKLLIIIGTRPEAIKLAILSKLLIDSEDFNPVICLTGQHTDMVDSILNQFKIQADFCLTAYKHRSSHAEMNSYLSTALQEIIEKVEPEMVIVQGDTLSAYVGALVSYFNKIPVVHIEAGLRTYNKFSPFPEELFRQAISKIAQLHMSPSELAKQNLLHEGINKEDIYLTGNTGIDSLLHTINTSKLNVDLENLISNIQSRSSYILLLTLHRRETHGNIYVHLLENINHALKNTDAELIFCTHPNPYLQKIIKTIDFDSNVHLIPQQDYEQFVALMKNVDLILTDSGGIQEEAPYLAKPVLVLRKHTERTEILQEDYNKLYQLERLEEDINNALSESSISTQAYYGEGKASQRIVDILKRRFILRDELL